MTCRSHSFKLINDDYHGPYLRCRCGKVEPVNIVYNEVVPLSHDEEIKYAITGFIIGCIISAVLVGVFT